MSMLRNFAAAAALLALAACGNEDFLGRDLGEALDLQDPSKGIVDAHGNVMSSVDLGDPVVVQVPRLNPNTAYVIRITDPNGVEYNPAGGLIATTNEQGTLYQHTVVQNLDSGANAAAVLAPPGEYRITLATGGSVVESVDFTVRDAARVFCANVSGAKRAAFDTGENVYARVQRGGGSLADGSYDLHLLSDRGAVLADGAGLPAPVATIVVAGGSGLADLGNVFAAGSYDVVVDVNDNDLFDQDTDLISRHRRLHACFTVRAPNSGNPIVEQVASDRLGNHREVFDPLAVQATPVADVHAHVTPGEASTVQETLGVDHYLVAHQDTWNDGDPLSDQTASVETAPVQGFSLSAAPALVLPREQMAGACYDLVVDMNRNGVFDAGIDVVDNIDENGTATCGVRLADAACAGNVQITSHDAVFSTLSTAIELEGTVTDAPLGGTITIASATQSNVLNLLPNPDFSAAVPLFNGLNFVTVAFYYADDSTCARTLVVSQGIDFNALFRVQLVWDGSTDMDLHLVRPGGDYENGGGGDGDCNYANCSVGLDGAGDNTIDWGTQGEEDDDPKLDVDCVACGTGIENIWMSQINENGSYTVYVDAFSGTESDVTVKVFIGGAQVGEVDCGDMSAGTGTDSCRAGTIDWSNNNGTFTPDGVKAADFP